MKKPRGAPCEHDAGVVAVWEGPFPVLPVQLSLSIPVRGSDGSRDGRGVLLGQCHLLFIWLVLPELGKCWF